MVKFNVYDKVTPVVDMGCEENGPRVGKTYMVTNVTNLYSSKDTIYLNGFGKRFSADQFRMVSQAISRDEDGNPLYVGDTVKALGALSTVIRGNDGPNSGWVWVRFANGEASRYASGNITFHSRPADEVKDTELVKLTWNMVEEGDTVTARYLETGTEVTDVVAKTGDWTRFLGWATKNGNIPLKFELLSITKPKPKLPTANGSIIRALPSGGEAILIAERWRWADSGYAARPSEWAEGSSSFTSWQLIRDPSQETKISRG